MSLIIYIFRLLSIFLLTTLPFDFVGGLFFGVKGLLCGFWGGALITSLLFLNLEKTIRRQMKWIETPSAGLVRSFQWVKGSRKKPPRLYLISQCEPFLVSCREAFGSGSIFVSQGLINLLKETELREVLRYAAQRCESRELSIQSLGSTLSVFLLKLMSEEWRMLAFSGRIPQRSGFRSWVGFFRFLLAYPFLRAVLLLGGCVSPIYSGVNNFSGLDSNQLHNFKEAMRKIIAKVQNFPFIQDPEWIGLRLPAEPHSKSLIDFS